MYLIDFTGTVSWFTSLSSDPIQLFFSILITADIDADIIALSSSLLIFLLLSIILLLSLLLLLVVFCVRLHDAVKNHTLPFNKTAKNTKCFKFIWIQKQITGTVSYVGFTLKMWTFRCGITNCCSNSFNLWKTINYQLLAVQYLYMS